MMSFKQYLREAAWHQLPNFEIHHDPDIKTIKKAVDDDHRKEARFAIHPKTNKAVLAKAVGSIHRDLMMRSGFNKDEMHDAPQGYVTRHGVNKPHSYSFSTNQDANVPEPPPGPLKPHPFYHSLRKAGIKDENPHRRDES